METVVFAAVAGLASFASPCMIPVIPAFIAQLGGTSLSEGELSKTSILVNTAFFVLGFSIVFSVLGVALNSVLQNAATEVTIWLSRVAGVLIIAFGLHLSGILEIPLLDQTNRAPVDLDGSPTMSLVFGASFAVGWTPCVGPILGSTFALASTQPVSAFPILIAYSLGLGIPFLCVALVPRRTINALRDRGETLRTVHHAFGFVLILLGVLVFTNRLSLLGSFPVVEEIVT